KHLADVGAVITKRMEVLRHAVQVRVVERIEPRHKENMHMLLTSMWKRRGAIVVRARFHRMQIAEATGSGDGEHREQQRSPAATKTANAAMRRLSSSIHPGCLPGGSHRGSRSPASRIPSLLPYSAGRMALLHEE